MAAPTPGAGTRGQTPGVGARGQRRRRNPVNAPSTWRGSKPLRSNLTPVALPAARGSSGSTAAGTVATATPLAGTARTGSRGVANLSFGTRLFTDAPRPGATIFPGPGQFPGESGSVTGSVAKATLTAPQVLAGPAVTGSLGSAALTVSVPFASTAGAGSRAFAFIVTEPGRLLTRRIPGVGAKGQPRRRNPVNAPRTFRGTKPLRANNPVVSLNAAGSSITASRATATELVVVPFVATGLAGVLGKGTLAAGRLLAGGGRGGSVGQASLTVTPSFGATVAMSGVVATASITLLPNTILQRSIPGVGAKGQPRRRNPVNAPRTFRGSRVLVPSTQTFNPITLQALARSGSLSTAIFFVLVQSFDGIGASGSIARGTLSGTAVTVRLTDGPYPGTTIYPGPRQFPGECGSVTSSRGAATLTFIVQPQGRGRSGSIAKGTLSARASLNGIGPTGSRGTGTFTSTISLAGRATTGSKAKASITIGPLAFSAFGYQASAATGSLSVAVKLNGRARAGSRSTAAVRVSIPVRGVATNATVGIGDLTIPSTHVSLTGRGVFGSSGLSILTVGRIFALQQGLVRPAQQGGVCSPQQEEALA